MNQLVSSFLDFLGLEKGRPSLSYLNSLVEQHQKKVRWETLTKIIDWENGNQTGNFLPSINVYIDRIVRLGAGGTCWSLARGFHWLLSELGFSVQYLYMDSGHLCLRVDIDQPYYVDVGYCAPLFQAYPLYQSFKVEDNREVFDYQTVDQNIIITRTPGPTKTLNPFPIQLEDMDAMIKRSNDWETSPVLKNIQIFAYVNDVPTSINNLVLKQYYPNEKREVTLSVTEMETFVTRELGINKELYNEAVSIYRLKHKLET